MFKKRILFLVLILFFSVFSFANNNKSTKTISVFDFIVQSDNTANTYIGKGISSLITTELRKNTYLRLVEREQINKVIDEQKLQLSGIADSSIIFGKLLSLDYMLLGTIIDMKSNFIFEIKLIDVETSEILWTESIIENLNAYEYVSTTIASSLLEYFDLKPNNTTATMTENKESKNEKIIINLSEGINELDTGNIKSARTFLKIAEKLDPGNETVQYFIDKLSRNTSRFKILAEPNYTYGNPAKLGLIEKDKLFYVSSFPPFGLYTKDDLYTNENLNYVYLPELDRSFSLREVRLKIGYSFPLLKKFGGQIEGFWFGTSEAKYYGNIAGYKKINDYWPSYYGRNGLGAVLSVGYSLTSRVSLGFGAGIYQGQGELEIATETSTNYSTNIGLVLLNYKKTVSFDSIFGYNSGTVRISNLTGDTWSSVNIPMYNENTISLSSNKNLMLVIKQRNMFRIEESYYQGTINPSLEIFQTDLFSYRGGIEGSYTFINDNNILGWGLLLGASYTSKNNKFGFDINVSYRQKPAFTFGDFLIPELIISSEISYEGLFLSRK